MFLAFASNFLPFPAEINIHKSVSPNKTNNNPRFDYPDTERASFILRETSGQQVLDGKSRTKTLKAIFCRTEETATQSVFFIRLAKFYHSYKLIVPLYIKGCTYRC